MSDDILSGGAIDQSTSGPIPPSRDDRDRDILLEQKERQDQDAIGGTQFPPKPQPLPPIPEAPEVAPQLPVIPSFDFNISGSALEEIREISRQTTIDVFKNVNINGQGPSIEGSTIAFSIPQQPPASEAFFFQGVVIPQAITETIPQLPQTIADIQSVEVVLPSGPTQQPQVKDFLPSETSTKLEGAAFDRLSEYRSFPEGEKYEGGQISDQGDLPRAKGYEGGAITDQGDLPRAEGYEGGQLSEYSTLSTPDEIKERREQERREDPNFDRESSQRQRGESQTEFRERQEQLKQERAERAQREEQLSRVRTGDLTEVPSGMIPVRFTRADGEKKILALMATELVGVVEGATGGERTIPLPAENSFYEGGGGGTTLAHPWKITIRTVQGSNPPAYEYAIESASRLFDGFGGSQIFVSGANGEFNAFAEGFYFIEVSFSDGEIDTAEIIVASSLGSIIETSGTPPVQTKLRQQIGYAWLEDGSPRLRQNAWHNYTLFDVCRNGVPVKATIAT